MTTKFPESAQPTRASEYRKKRKPFLVQASADLVVLMKPLDITEAFFSNLIPMPATGMKDKFDQLQARLESGDVSAMHELFGLEGGDTETRMREFFQRYAMAVVIEPTLVAEDDGNPDHIPVTDLTRFELLNIWNADPLGKEPPVMTPERVEEFRGSEPRQDDYPVQDGADTRSEAQFVDLGDREVISA